jgi:hypothetical protein
MNLYLKRLNQKLKYNSILRVIHDGLVNTGINISPFYIVEEGLHLNPALPQLKRINNYSIEFLKKEDADIFSSIPERSYTKDVIIDRIENGSNCLIVKKDRKLVGYTWYNLFECNASIYKFKLKKDEAYLFDAYVLLEYRGEKIAPFMRYTCYKELKKLNRTTLYSISEFLNNQSISFKKKLNAKFLALMVYVNLFNKITFSRQIKNYGIGNVPGQNP